jgi:hypothetical protein
VIFCTVLYCAVIAICILGVVLCDSENPCEGIVFNNVTNTPFTGNIDKLLQDLPYTYPQHDSLRVSISSGAGTSSSAPAPASMPFGDYISSYAYGKAVDPVSPTICLEEGCWWTGKSLSGDRAAL